MKTISTLATILVVAAASAQTQQSGTTSGSTQTRQTQSQTQQSSGTSVNRTGNIQSSGVTQGSAFGTSIGTTNRISSTIPLHPPANTGVGVLSGQPRVGITTTNQIRVGTNASIGVSGQGAAPGITEPSGAARADQAGPGSQLDRSFTAQVKHAVTVGGTHSIFAPISGSIITVTTDNGIVTLRGNVRNEGERRSIEARLNSLNITSVDNQLQIAPNAIIEQTIPENTTTNQSPLVPLTPQGTAP